MGLRREKRDCFGPPVTPVTSKTRRGLMRASAGVIATFVKATGLWGYLSDLIRLGPFSGPELGQFADYNPPLIRVMANRVAALQRLGARATARGNGSRRSSVPGTPCPEARCTPPGPRPKP
jgi:hypothetical protein